MTKRKTIKKPASNQARMGKNQKKTGAPPADFFVALKWGNLTKYIIEQTQFKRNPLAQESTANITKSIHLNLLELARRVVYPPYVEHVGLENAAEDLAAMGSIAAMLLKDLAPTNAAEINFITLAAARRHDWPVNMSLGRKKKKGSSELAPTLHGADKVKDYLIDIQLGEDPHRPLHSLDDPNATLFTKAAELLLNDLLEWREQGAWGTPTPWAKQLYALGDLPMTTDNVNKWWSVAKQWMDEQWETNPELFKPLIASCKSKGESLAGGRHMLYASEVKRNVIDVMLKNAFFALKKPADL